MKDWQPAQNPDQEAVFKQPLSGCFPTWELPRNGPSCPLAPFFGRGSFKINFIQGFLQNTFSLFIPTAFAQVSEWMVLKGSKPTTPGRFLSTEPTCQKNVWIPPFLDEPAENLAILIACPEATSLCKTPVSGVFDQVVWLWLKTKQEGQTFRGFWVPMFPLTGATHFGIFRFFEFATAVKPGAPCTKHASVASAARAPGLEPAFCKPVFSGKQPLPLAEKMIFCCFPLLVLKGNRFDYILETSCFCFQGA